MKRFILLAAVTCLLVGCRYSFKAHTLHKVYNIPAIAYVNGRVLLHEGLWDSDDVCVEDRTYTLRQSWHCVPLFEVRHFIMQHEEHATR